MGQYKMEGNMNLNNTFEIPKNFSRWHHLAAYDENGELLGLSNWIDPVHGHGLPLEDVYVKPMKDFIINNQKLPYSYVQLGPTNSCNLACEGCYSAETRNGYTLNFDQVKSVIEKVYDQVKRANSYTAMVSFHGPGEPLSSPQNREIVLKAINLCNEYGLVNRITTNASFDDDEYIEELVKSPSLKLIWVSMKAGDGEKYLQYTGKDKFEQVCHNMKLFSECRRKFNRTDLVLKASTEISKYCIEETIDAAKIAKSVGFDVFKPALHSVDFHKAYMDKTEEVINLRNQLIDLFDGSFNSLYWEIPKKYSNNYHADKFPAEFCYQIETRIYFDGKGKMSPCIAWLDKNGSEYDFGNINDLSCFEQLEDVTDFNKNKESLKQKLCSKCSDPWVSYFHKWIHDILKKNMNAKIVKVFDDEIEEKYPQLCHENVLEGFDPRADYYD